MTIKATGVVDEYGELTVRIHTGFPQGLVKLELLVADHLTDAVTAQDQFRFPVLDVGPLPAGFSLTREDLYDDWGR